RLRPRESRVYAHAVAVASAAAADADGCLDQTATAEYPDSVRQLDRERASRQREIRDTQAFERCADRRHLAVERAADDRHSPERLGERVVLLRVPHGVL